MRSGKEKKKKSRTRLENSNGDVTSLRSAKKEKRKKSKKSKREKRDRNSKKEPTLTVPQKDAKVSSGSESGGHN
jgi:hypothetical protein